MLILMGLNISQVELLCILLIIFLYLQSILKCNGQEPHV